MVLLDEQFLYLEATPGQTGQIAIDRTHRRRSIGFPATGPRRQPPVTIAITTTGDSAELQLLTVPLPLSASRRPHHLSEVESCLIEHPGWSRRESAVVGKTGPRERTSGGQCLCGAAHRIPRPRCGTGRAELQQYVKQRAGGARLIRAK